MPLNQYGVLKGQATDFRLGVGSSPHYQIRINDGQTDYRVAVNVKSAAFPSELLYYVADDFHHPVLDALVPLAPGFHALTSVPSGGGLDLIRGNLLDVRLMQPLPDNVAGPNNDLNELIDGYVQRALAEEEAFVYAFGQRWGPETQADRYFSFKPGNGIHDIHMNQGNLDHRRNDDGVWQDGGMLFQFSTHWVALFLAFQSQSFHTDDRTGHRLAEVPQPQPTPPPVTEPGQPAPTPDPLDREAIPDLRIIAALVNPSGDDPGHESVTLINTSAAAVDLSGWMLADRNKKQHTLSNMTLGAGDTLRIPLSGATIQLGNKGGLISLLNPQGIKIHGVAYTADQVGEQGRSITF